MRKSLLAVFFLVFCFAVAAQQAMNNDAIIKMAKAGLSDDLIVTTINSSPGTYDTSVNGLIALKQAGVSDKVVAAMVAKASHPRATTQPDAAPGLSPAQPSPVPTQPRVFLQSQSKGNQWNAVRDQSMEMSKDFEKDCPSIHVTINQNTADYTVLLNHIESGFLRDNQFQIANRSGDLISKTSEGGSINSGVKKACKIILDDWVKNGPISQPQ